MGYVNNVHNVEGYKLISGFGNTFVCNNNIDEDKTINFPDGWNNDTNLSFKVIFQNGHNCVNDSTNMTLNDVAVVVNKYGVLIPLPIHTFDEGGTSVYKSLQPNTVLEMYYTSNYDGADTPAFVIIGNPIVLSDTDYTIYADGYNEKQWLNDENELDNWETITISTDPANQTVMQYDGFISFYYNFSGYNNVGSSINIYVNNELIVNQGFAVTTTSGGYFIGSNGAVLPVKKGDTIYTGAYTGTLIVHQGRFYKKRHYDCR